MANVSADIAWPAKSDLCVHICAIHVNLTAVAVDDLADLANRGLEHPMRAGIGDHQRPEISCVRVGLGAQISQIDIAVL